MVTDHVSVTAVNSTTSADRSLVQSVVEGTFSAGDMAIAGPSPERVDEIQGLLQRLVSGEVGILRLKVHGPDGTILFSDDASLRGSQFEPSGNWPRSSEADSRSTDSQAEADLAGSERRRLEGICPSSASATWACSRSADAARWRR